MDQTNVVLRYRDGRTERIPLANIDAERQFVVAKSETARTEVPFSLLKGIFFPHRDPDETSPPASGTRSVRPSRYRSTTFESIRKAPAPRDRGGE